MAMGASFGDFVWFIRHSRFPKVTTVKITNRKDMNRNVERRCVSTFIN